MSPLLLILATAGTAQLTGPGLPRIDIIHADSEEYPMVADVDYLGTMTIQNRYGSAFSLYNGGVEFGIGGNYTGTLPKKPFNLKLKSGGSTISDDVLDMLPSSEEYRWLANYDDPLVGIRNQILLSLGDGEVPYTPKFQYAELWYEGQPYGLGILAQRVKRKSALPTSALPAMPGGGTPEQGGMAWELDNYTDEGESYIDTAGGVHIKWNYPNKASVTVAHQDFGEQLFADLETAIAAGDLSMIDVTSFARTNVIHAFLLNRDAFNGSTYYMLPVGGLLTSVALWDGALSFGNPNPDIAGEPQWNNAAFNPFLNDSTRGWNEVLWEVPEYVDAFVSEFTRLKPIMQQAVVDARETYEYLKGIGAYARNAAVWDFYGTELTPEYMDAQMTHLENFAAARLNYMQSQIDAL